MGNSEEGKVSKSEKSPSPVVDQNNMHVYPDWAAMQGFYGPRFAVPPYVNTAVASPHSPPPYMWGSPQFSQSMISPFGAPYAAFYAHGGVYAHPGVTLAGTAMTVETPVKSSGNADGGFVKKLKEFDGLAISIGNGNGDSTENGSDRRLSDSDETGDSSDGSNGVATGAGQNGKKRRGQGSLDREDGKAHKKTSSAHVVDVGRTSEKTMDVITPVLELNDPSLDAKSCPANVALPSIPKEPLLENERELKRERRKQSNRESARRSRLRKQAETEELAVKVQGLNSENMTLKSEINKLMASSEKLKLENGALLEKLKGVQVLKIDELRPKPVGTVNLLARVNNSDVRNEDSESYEIKSSPGAKLHQLLDSSPRTDAVAAV